MATAPTPPRPLDLVGRVAVITGASRGIGRAVAAHLAARGCSVLGTCTGAAGVAAIGTALADAVRAQFARQGRAPPAAQRIRGLVADILAPDCAARIADALEAMAASADGDGDGDDGARPAARVDILVLGACDPSPGEIGAMAAEEIRRSLLANVQTPVLVVEELVRRRLFRPEGRIVYLSSVRARQPWAGQLMYAAGKSAGESLCRTWAQAFGGKEEKYQFMAGTTANAVAIGLTETDAVMNCGPEMVAEFQKEFFPTQSIPRFGQPEDVADVVGLLCSADARWITGCVVSASGGGIKIG